MDFAYLCIYYQCIIWTPKENTDWCILTYYSTDATKQQNKHKWRKSRRSWPSAWISGATGYCAKMKFILLAYHQPTTANRVYYPENNTGYISSHFTILFLFLERNMSIAKCFHFDWSLFTSSKPIINFFQVSCSYHLTNISSFFWHQIFNFNSRLHCTWTERETQIPHKDSAILWKQDMPTP